MAARKKALAASSRSDNGRAGIQPSVRTYTGWTPALIASAEAQADSGNLRAAANLTEWILQDDRVQGALGARVGALLGLEPTFEASGDKRRSKRPVKALELGDDWWDSFPETESGLILRWAIVLGFGLARHGWDEVEGHDGRILPMPEFWHPQHVRYDWPTRRWMTRIQQGPSDAGVAETEIVPGDSDWLFHRPYGKARPWAWGLWHALAPLVLIKHLAEWDFSRAGERGALLVGTTQEGILPVDGDKPAHRIRQDLAEQLYQRGRDGVCILPAGFDLKMLALAAGTPELYGKQIAMANEAIAVNIRGGNLSTNVEGGSRAAAEVQERTGDQANLRQDAQAWTTTVHNDSLKPWAEFNYGDRNLAPWPVYPVEPKRDLKRSGETANSALDAAKKARDLGFKVKPKEFSKAFELDEWLEADGELLPPTPPPAPPGAPGATIGTPPGTVAPPALPPKGKAAPKAPAAGEKEADGEGDDDRPEARGARRILALASGDPLRKGRGFVEGQLYTDALAERASEAGIAALEPTIAALLEELDAASDYDDLRTRLRARYEDLDPEELSDIVYAVIALGELAGRTATNQDA